MMMVFPERKVLFLLASFLGGFLIFRLSDITNSPCLKAPLVHRNIRDTPDTSKMAVDGKALEDLRRRAIQALFVSKNTLPFCKPTSNAKSKGKFLSYEVFMLIGMKFNTSKTYIKYQLSFSRILYFRFSRIRWNIPVKKAAAQRFCSFDRTYKIDGLL